MNKTKLGLIYGGKSSEHEVSLRTAFSLLNALDYTKYVVFPFYITLEGKWVEGGILTDAPKEVEALRLENNTQPIDVFTLKDKVDIIFPVIHGPYGEDGTLQGFLEMLDIPYVGCGVLASSAGMDKILMKDVFKSAGLPQCNYLHFTRTSIEENATEILMEIEQTLGFPCFVKPANLGSSVGISKAHNRDSLLIALQFASKFDRRVIVEEFIEGKEVEIGVLGNEQLTTSVVGEIFSAGDFYDYSAKYKNIGTKLQIPAHIPSEVSEEISSLAKKAFKSLDGSGLSRIDFFYNEQSGTIYINEINTMPGFTAFSMYPMLFKETGIDYTTLIEQLISFGISRFNEKKRNQILAEDFKQ